MVCMGSPFTPVMISPFLNPMFRTRELVLIPLRRNPSGWRVIKMRHDSDLPASGHSHWQGLHLFETSQRIFSVFWVRRLCLVAQKGERPVFQMKNWRFAFFPFPVFHLCHLRAKSLFPLISSLPWHPGPYLPGGIDSGFVP